MAASSMQFHSPFADASAVLKVTGLSAAIGPGIALSKLDFEVVAGTVTTVIGPNGAGKTSLLRAICNDLARQAGQVALNDRPMEEWSIEQRAKVMSVLPQRSTLEFPFTVQEVVKLGRIPHSTSFVRNREIVDAALAMVDCRQFAERFYINLSGGEKQRVQLARVAAQLWEEEADHRCLILDEPTSSLDLAHQAMVLDMIRFFAQQGVAILTVLHDLNLASKCADQILVLDKGAAAAIGTPGEVLNEALLAEVFRISATVSTNASDGSPLVIT